MYIVYTKIICRISSKGHSHQRTRIGEKKHRKKSTSLCVAFIKSSCIKKTVNNALAYTIIKWKTAVIKKVLAGGKLLWTQ